MVSPEVTVFISIRIKKKNNIYTSLNMANIQAGGQKDGRQINERTTKKWEEM